MEALYEKYLRKIDLTSIQFTRSIMDTVRWDARLVGIMGARGVGKTTLMLQYIKKNLPVDHSTLYVSLDNIWFSENSLSSLTDNFVKRGGKFLFLDEVHKYPNWSQELKNIYDDYPQLKVVFTGSSLLEILNARADLSRRAVVYNMQGLSYREYLNLKLGLTLPVVTFKEILEKHPSIVRSIISKVKPLQYFKRVSKRGLLSIFSGNPRALFTKN